MTGLSRPDTKAGRTQREVLELLGRHADDEYGLPTTIRFVFYELEQVGLATKPSADDTRPNRRRSKGWPPGQQDITDAVTHLRENGIIPWDWIADEQRQLYAWDYADTVSAYVHERLDEARLNPWGDKPPRLILCESKATAAALRPLAADYCCPISGLGGHVAGFLQTRVVPYLRDHGYGDGNGDVAYLGDLDRSGVDIENNARSVISSAVDIGSWERVAMTEELAAQRGIEPIWKTDGRSGTAHEAIEVESLGQAALVDLLRARLDQLLPEPLSDVHERERQQRAEIAALLDDGRGQP